MRARRSGSEPRTASRVEAGAHPVEESPVGRGDLLTAQLGEPAEKLLLLGTQLRRDLDVDADEQVAASTAAQRGHALALDPLDAARLRAGRHDDLLLVAIERPDREAGAERGLGEADRAHVHEVVAVAVEHGVRSDRDVDVQVTRNTAPRRGGTALGQAESLPAVDPRGHLDVDAPGGVHATFAPAVAARREDLAAGGAARRARRRRDHLAEDRAADLAHLARPSADVATRRVRPGLASRAVAPLARDRHPDLDRVHDTERRLLQRELDRDLGVDAPRRARRTPAVAEGVAAEERIEDVPQSERVPSGPGPRTPGRGAFRAEHVVPPAPLRIAQSLVRDRDLLEARFGVGIVRVGIRVMLARQRAVGALDLGLRSVG